MVASLKICILALAFLALAPVQLIALARGSPFATRPPIWFHRLAAAVLGLRVRQIGAMSQHRPLLIVANHTSWLDIVTLGSIAPVSFIAKSEVAGWPFVRTLARLHRTAFVDRARRAATRKAADSIGARLAQGDAMVLFAEGTTSSGDRVLPFRSALFGAAQATGLAGARAQPAAVAYTRRRGLPPGRAGRPAIAWYGAMDLAPHLWGLLQGGGLDAVVVWGPPRAIERLADRKAIAAELEAWVREAYAAALHGRAATADLSNEARNA